MRGDGRAVVGRATGGGLVGSGLRLTEKEKAAAKRLLERKAREHDQLERDMLVLMRKFTDEELRAMGMAAGG